MAFLLGSAFVVASCNAESTAQGSFTAQESPRPEAGDCANLQSNLEYTECWQARASETQLQVDAALVRLQQAAELSDEREGGGATDEYQIWLREVLASSHSAWIEFSERQCELEGRVARGGTGTRALVAQCRYRLNNQRIDELDEVIDAINRLWQAKDE